MKCPKCGSSLELAIAPVPDPPDDGEEVFAKVFGRFWRILRPEEAGNNRLLSDQ